MNELDVTVVIPCLNEEDTIGICVSKAKASLSQNGLTGEVIVSDNGSTDRSVEIATSFGACVVHQPLKGYGNALRKGIDEARGTFIIMGDADDSYDFSELNRFVEKWREGNDLVMGTRFRGKILPGAMPWHHRWIGNPVLTGILNLLFKAGITDAHCGMRGFSREAYYRMDIRTTGMEFASELVIKAAKLNLKVAEIPITYHPDKRNRPPHLRSFRDGWRHLRFMLMFSPNHLFLIPGVLFFLLGMVLLIALFPGPLQVFGTTLDVHTMIFGMVFTLLGLQIISIGLFAKIFSHTERISHGKHSLEKYLKRFTLETGLLLGGVTAFIGFIGDALVFIQWAQSGFGPLAQIRLVILASTLLLVGIEIIFASFFLSMLGISRDTYVGDYEKRGVSRE
jgi:glycosyltransferase involved in cell wall biosynthesis